MKTALGEPVNKVLRTKFTGVGGSGGRDPDLHFI